MKLNSFITYFLFLLFTITITAQKSQQKIDSVSYGNDKEYGTAIFHYKDGSITKIENKKYSKDKKSEATFFVVNDTLLVKAIEKSNGLVVESKFEKNKLVSQSDNESLHRINSSEEHRLLNDFNKYRELSNFDENAKPPFLKKDTIVFGILMLLLGFVFFTSNQKDGFWSKFYKIVPALFIAYFLPAILTTLGVIAPEWETVSNAGEVTKHKSSLYYMASRYLLPAALVLMTLSIDLKAVFNLGWKALAMFFAGTLGIVIGGPIAILIIAAISPETVGGVGADAVWRGLSTLAGSWIGGGANQTAMKEIFNVPDNLFGTMIVVDVIVANIWMAVILFGVNFRDRVNRFLKADNSSILDLERRMEAYHESVKKIPTTTETFMLLAVAFGSVAIAHWGADVITPYMESHAEFLVNANLQSLMSGFFWLIVIATTIGMLLSFTPARKMEGVGATRWGSVFIYILVATIGLKMNLAEVFENLGLFAVGIVWMLVHVVILLITAKLIKAPFFFVAVGSQANVGGAASAPIVASAFNPSLASVGVLMAVLGYALGTYGALVCAMLMKWVALS